MGVGVGVAVRVHGGSNAGRVTGATQAQGGGG